MAHARGPEDLRDPRQIWDFAKEKGYVEENIVAGDGVKVPKRDTEEKRALTSEQVVEIMDGLLSEELTAPRFGLLLIMCTGMRLSEMLTLPRRV